MNRLILFLFAVFIQPIYAAPVADITPDKVGPNSYVIHGPLGRPSPENRGFMNSRGFVVSPEGIVVIDPGGSLQVGEMVLRQIKIVSPLPVIAVLNTHIHGDHWLGNQAIRNQYPEVPIYGHPKMILQVEAGEGERWRTTMLQLTNNATEGTVVIGPNKELEGGDIVTLGGIQFNIIYLEKAHSDTDIMIEIPTENLLFLGDNVLSKRLGQMTHGTFKGNIQAISLALESSVKNYVPGHGITGDQSMVKRYQSYLSLILHHVGEMLDEGLADYEMKPLIRKLTAEYSSWVGYEDELGRHISLAFLEVEADAF